MIHTDLFRGVDQSIIASRSALSSNAAGCGGSGFVSLTWSEDGGTLAGLSDRLCCWRLVTRAVGGGGGGIAGGGSHHVLDRSRVVRVFDTTDRRNRLFVSCSSPGTPILPPTLITLEVHSGICFVFDPIEVLPTPVSGLNGDPGGLNVAAAAAAPGSISSIEGVFEM